MEYQYQRVRRQTAENRARQLHGLYTQGWTLAEIAAKEGVTRQCIHSLFQKYGLATIKRRRKARFQAVLEAIQLYQAGHTLAQIGQHYGVSPGTVWQAFRSSGFPLRPPGRPPAQ